MPSIMQDPRSQGRGTLTHGEITMTTETLPSIPEPLQSISEVVEMAAFFESGQVLPKEYVLEATITPPLSAENRALLCGYIEQVNDNTEYFAEHTQYDDMDVVVAMTLPWSTVMSLCAKFGLFSKA
jgi:hypothetical protein